jgi:hypothetical protein
MYQKSKEALGPRDTPRLFVFNEPYALSILLPTRRTLSLLPVHRLYKRPRSTGSGSAVSQTANQGCPAYIMRHSMQDYARLALIGPYRLSFLTLIWARTLSAWFGVSASRHRGPRCCAPARLKPWFKVLFPSYTHSPAPHYL